MAYNGRRGPNVSEYIANLNAIPSAQDLQASDSLDFENDLALFTNTQFFDFDLGQDADLQETLTSGRNDHHHKTETTLPTETFEFGQGEPYLFITIAYIDPHIVLRACVFILLYFVYTWRWLWFRLLLRLQPSISLSSLSRCRVLSPYKSCLSPSGVSTLLCYLHTAYRPFNTHQGFEFTLSLAQIPFILFPHIGSFATMVCSSSAGSSMGRPLFSRLSPSSSCSLLPFRLFCRWLPAARDWSVTLPPRHRDMSRVTLKLALITPQHWSDHEILRDPPDSLSLEGHPPLVSRPFYRLSLRLHVFSIFWCKSHHIANPAACYTSGLDFGRTKGQLC